MIYQFLLIQITIFLINSSAQINSECKCDDADIQESTNEENRIKTDQRHCVKKMIPQNNLSLELR